MRTYAIRAIFPAVLALLNVAREFAADFIDRCDEPGITSCAVEAGHPVDALESDYQDAVAMPRAASLSGIALSGSIQETASFSAGTLTIS